MGYLTLLFFAAGWAVVERRRTVHRVAAQQDLDSAAEQAATRELEAKREPSDSSMPPRPRAVRAKAFPLSGR